ncbi:MAG: histidine phosphatase family protein [Sphingobium sp.]|nr:histidine phosphatase family protein [Sphingobium sp.]
MRHPPVALGWAGRCYGRSDMGWSREGAAMARRLVPALAAEGFDRVIHSGLHRTRRLAEAVARASGASLSADPRWAERDFGDWEGRRWDAIWRETGDAMDGMITDPECFRPGGGETTAELAARAWAAWQDLPSDGSILVVAHGGPIAVVRMRLAGSDYPALAGLIPPPGEIVKL